jgi:hypothetical protein
VYIFMAFSGAIEPNSKKILAAVPVEVEAAAIFADEHRIGEVFPLPRRFVPQKSRLTGIREPLVHGVGLLDGGIGGGPDDLGVPQGYPRRYGDAFYGQEHAPNGRKDALMPLLHAAALCGAPRTRLSAGKRRLFGSTRSRAPL